MCGYTQLPVISFSVFAYKQSIYQNIGIVSITLKSKYGKVVTYCILYWLASPSRFSTALSSLEKCLWRMAYVRELTVYNLQNDQSFYFLDLETVRKAAKLAVYEAMMMNPNSHLFIITSTT